MQSRHQAHRARNVAAANPEHCSCNRAHAKYRLFLFCKSPIIAGQPANRKAPGRRRKSVRPILPLPFAATSRILHLRDGAVDAQHPITIGLEIARRIDDRFIGPPPEPATTRTRE